MGLKCVPLSEVRFAMRVTRDMKFSSPNMLLQIFGQMPVTGPQPIVVPSPQPSQPNRQNGGKFQGQQQKSRPQPIPKQQPQKPVPRPQEPKVTEVYDEADSIDDLLKDEISELNEEPERFSSPFFSGVEESRVECDDEECRVVEEPSLPAPQKKSPQIRRNPQHSNQ